jgi:hypothetical protein
MGAFRAFPISPRRWGIEEIVPGEPPTTLPFIGTKTQVEKEVHRLNLFGLGTDNTVSAKRPSYPREANQLANRIIDLATSHAHEEKPVDSTPAPKVGRPGGLKCGDAQPKALRPERRVEIARKAAAKR